MPGFAAKRSRQRAPLPKFCCAIFHSESPGFTITALSFAVPFSAAGTAGGREGAMRRGAGTKVLGRSNGERLPGGREGEGPGAKGFESRGRAGSPGGLGEGGV